MYIFSKQHINNHLKISLIPFIIFFGCSAKNIAPKSAEQLFYMANQDVENEDYEKAREKLQTLEALFPSSELLAQARLAAADCFFKDKRWDEAVVKYKNFLDLHPTHQFADKAQYFIAKSFMNKLDRRRDLLLLKGSLIDRDLTPVYRAKEELEKLFKLYPYSKYLTEAEKDYHRCREILARNQYYIGMFYFNTKHYGAAANRFRKIMRDYYDVTQVYEDAYYYFGECYLKSGKNEESQHIFRSFLNKFPTSQHEDSARAYLGG